jgi:hypothetical protein
MGTPGWQSYEDVAVYILRQMASEFGLERVEGKQLVGGKSGTVWEIDGKGIPADNSTAFIVIECRRYTSPGRNKNIWLVWHTAFKTRGSRRNYCKSPRPARRSC